MWGHHRHGRHSEELDDFILLHIDLRSEQVLNVIKRVEIDRCRLHQRAKIG